MTGAQLFSTGNIVQGQGSLKAFRIDTVTCGGISQGNSPFDFLSRHISSTRDRYIIGRARDDAVIPEIRIEERTPRTAT